MQPDGLLVLCYARLRDQRQAQVVSDFFILFHQPAACIGPDILAQDPYDKVQYADQKQRRAAHARLARHEYAQVKSYAAAHEKQKQQRGRPVGNAARSRCAPSPSPDGWDEGRNREKRKFGKRKEEIRYLGPPNKLISSFFFPCINPSLQEKGNEPAGNPQQTHFLFPLFSFLFPISASP